MFLKGYKSYIAGVGMMIWGIAGLIWGFVDTSISIGAIMQGLGVVGLRHAIK